MKGMKQQQIDKETAKYNAVAEIAALLRETTKPRLVTDFTQTVTCDENGNNIHPKVLHENFLFSKEEHETVKRAFLRLVSEI